MIAVEEIELQTESEAEAWDAFVRDDPGGLVYYSSRFGTLLVDHLGCEAEYLVARESGEIRGALPVMWASDPQGRVCNSLPFYGSHGGPLADGPEAERALLDAWNERVTDSGTLAGTMVGNPFREREAADPQHTLDDSRIGQATPLPAGAGEDEVMGLYSKNGRRDVRRSDRLGVEVARDTGSMDSLCRIHQENIRAVGGRAKPAEFFEAVPRHLRAGEDYDLWTARLDDAVIGGLLVLYFNRVAEYFTPAVESERRSAEPMALILHRAMQEAAARNCRLWNWGGTWSSQDGVFKFKRKWGAQEYPYRYFVQVNDESLLDSPADELLLRFPDFYVAPFSALRSASKSQPTH